MTIEERIARLENAVALLIDQVGRTEFNVDLQEIGLAICGLPPINED